MSNSSSVHNHNLLNGINNEAAHQSEEDKTIVPAIPYHIWYSRGKMLTQQGHFEAALTSFDIALKHQSNLHQIWTYRGIVLAYLKHYEAALLSFNKALELAPDNREIWIFRGAVLTYLNRRREALNSYNIALSIQQCGFTVCEDYPTTWMPNPIVEKGRELKESS
ncbi:tetratricopeptide repeat protein [Leptothermofonsia sp. ETS-13]|uniref:tetratricopeptide repeat protein n=1 Tax=Leptothermofonsia sp. ETS-13 TaxID=3035696 RepID=UPI003BA35AFC